MGKVLCLMCNTVLESRYTHDFQQCDCENQTFVDGGDTYLRSGGVDLDKVLIITDDLSYEVAKKIENIAESLKSLTIILKGEGK